MAMDMDTNTVTEPIEEAPISRPTMRLRYLKCDKHTAILQQMWIEPYTGYVEWRNIPTVGEGIANTNKI